MTSKKIYFLEKELELLKEEIEYFIKRCKDKSMLREAISMKNRLVNLEYALTFK